jgi:hypothetical protein
MIKFSRYGFEINFIHAIPYPWALNMDQFTCHKNCMCVVHLEMWCQMDVMHKFLGLICHCNVNLVLQFFKAKPRK